MRELIRITEHDGKKSVSARELYDFLQVTERFSRWFERMAEYGLEKGVDFTPYQRVHPFNGQSFTDYALTIDAAKETAMLQRSDKGKKARQYFIECERQLQQKALVVPQTLKDALYLAYVKECEVEEQKQIVAILAPKAEFYDAVADSTDTLEIQEVAKILNIEGVGRNTMFRLLRERRVLMQSNEPYQKYVDAGWFKCIETTWTDKYGEPHINRKTVVFQKGVDGIRRLLSRKLVGA